MDKNREKQPHKRKLTREELLEGKCDPNEPESKAKDPRIKSPDEILLQMMVKNGGKPVKNNTTPPPPPKQPVTKKADTPPHFDVVINSVNGHEPNGKVQDPIDINALQQKYSKERSQWREYEQNINHWKNHVLQIVQNMKKDILYAQSIMSDLENQKKLNQQKDEEIENLKKELKKHHRGHK